MRKKWLIITLVVLGVLGFFYISKKTQKPKLNTVHPTIQSLKKTLEVTGDVDAVEKADLKFMSMNRLSWIGVKEGDTVKKWQSLAKVDTRTTEKQLQIYLNNFGKEYRDHEQTLDNNNYYDNPDITKELKRSLENAQFDLNNTVLNVEIQDLAIKLSSLISPIDGIVTHIDKPQAGLNVSVTDGIQIVNPKTVFFGAVVDEVDIAKVQPDQSVNLVLDAYPDEEFPTTVGRIEFTPSTSRSGGTGFRVHLDIPAKNDNFKFKLGMSGTAQILLDQKENVLTLPIDCLTAKDGQNYVEVLENGKQVKKPVKTGLENDDFFEILDGVTQDDWVIIPSNGKK